MFFEFEFLLIEKSLGVSSLLTFQLYDFLEFKTIFNMLEVKKGFEIGLRRMDLRMVRR